MKRPQKLAVMLVPTPPYEICGLAAAVYWWNPAVHFLMNCPAASYGVSEVWIAEYAASGGESDPKGLKLASMLSRSISSSAAIPCGLIIWRVTQTTT